MLHHRHGGNDGDSDDYDGGGDNCSDNYDDGGVGLDVLVLIIIVLVMLYC